eukprot:NODE_1986_length_708_cov_81.238240_g1675_i0.p1 GENE.NODE_1986_length_708_cov_81.238240_g1675_i0~~NODE_1986_length_708_cov_81.238240_g1675_i0.p1  ORF type:complete len:206 (-),score=51.00 NODE_1986_length_708_cov_81.238240_g1675_i0:90-686(-)
MGPKPKKKSSQLQQLSTKIPKKKKKAAVDFFAVAKMGQAKKAIDERVKESVRLFMVPRNMHTRVDKSDEEFERRDRLTTWFQKLQRMHQSRYLAELEAKQQLQGLALAALPTELRQAALLPSEEQPPVTLRQPSLTPPVAGYGPAIGKLPLIDPEKWVDPDRLLWDTLQKLGFDESEINHVMLTETEDERNFRHGVGP